MLYITIDRNLRSHTLDINTTSKKDTTMKKGIVKIKYLKVRKVTKKEKKKVVAKAKTIPKKNTGKKTKNQSIPLVKNPAVKKEPLDLKNLFVIHKEEQNERKIEIQKVKKIQKEIEEIKKLPIITQNYIKLYGEQYFKYSKKQRKY